jgi:hypothetical protein
VTTTLTLTGLIVVMAAFVFCVDWLERRAKRRNRSTVRRVQRYLESLPPAKPW